MTESSRAKTRAVMNGTTLVVGGGLQVCINLIKSSLDDTSIDWTYMLSPEVESQLINLGIEIPANKLVIVTPSPAASLSSRRRLSALVESTAPDVVLTVFGPAYVRFRARHIMGVAQPWVTNGSWLAYRHLGSLRAVLQKAALSAYRGWWFRKADYWIVETEAVRAGFISRSHVPADNVHVISNNCGGLYLTRSFSSSWPGTATAEILVFSADYPHKLLEMVPHVAHHLVRLGHSDRFRFHLTLDKAGRGWHRIQRLARDLGVESHVVNEGTISLADGPALYDRHNLLFLPTLLECFTATYPEAMAAGRPIVTSDLSFSRAICADGAAYFRPADPIAAAQAIVDLLNHRQRWEDLIERGARRLSEFPSPDQKYQLYRERIFSACGKSA